jgi:predicted RNA-binding Zn ribbon-like protein
MLEITVDTLVEPLQGGITGQMTWSIERFWRTSTESTANEYDGIMTIKVSVDDVQAAGFPMGGEPFVALDLADTVMTVGDPPTDLIEAPSAAAAWWKVQARRLPPGPVPDPAAVRRLRAAIRDLLDAHLEGRKADPTSLEDVNATAASVPTSPRLVTGGAGGADRVAGAPGLNGRVAGGLREETRWHTEHGGNAALAMIAGEVVTLLATPERLERLRRCANPDCSMLFLAENRRRTWCAGNVCGNRVRVARHYDRTHTRDAPAR